MKEVDGKKKKTRVFVCNLRGELTFWGICLFSLMKIETYFLEFFSMTQFCSAAGGYIVSDYSCSVLPVFPCYILYYNKIILRLNAEWTFVIERDRTEYR